MERHLAAVLIADVVGYSRLSEIDEEGTRARFQTDFQQIFEPKITEHHGRLVKTMGDGILAEFHSVVDALRCAVDIQQDKAKRNATALPGEHLFFRIGINLGDIIVEGDDIHGEGVNIADRMQSLAEPGGIALSGTTYDHVKSKIASLGYAFLGEQKVKGIAEPVRVYRVVLDPEAKGATTRTRRYQSRWSLTAMTAVLLVVLGGAGAGWLTNRLLDEPPSSQNVSNDTRPSLVVLPFDNLSDVAEQGYLADGITEDLTTELARVSGLFVVSRNAAFTYKQKSLRPVQIAAELKVRYLLEGSIRRIGDEMRINAQLIDATTNGHIWAERFDGAWNEVFALQDKMVGEIATALKLRLVSGQQAAKIAGGTTNAAAYESYLRGRELEFRERPEDWVDAIKHYEQALALDPKFGNAAAGLAWIYREAQWSEARSKLLGLSSNEARNKENAYFRAAAENPSPMYYRILTAKLNMQQRSDEAIVAAERAIALDASDAENYESLSIAMIYNGRAMDGLGYLAAASRVDPFWSRWRYLLAGQAYFSLERYGEAVAALEKIEPETKETTYWDFWPNYDGLVLLISAYAQLGQSADAAKARERLKPYLAIAQDPEFTGLMAAGAFPFKHYSDLERVLAGLRKAGVPELSFGFDPKSPKRLDGAAIRTLLFGHEAHGRNLESGDAYRRVTADDGATRVFVGDWSDTGQSWLEGDFLCFLYPSRWRTCGVVFRNPGGTSAEKTEYLFITQWDRFEFSVVK
ncbi:TolB-like protein/class 3 adenylate cyclase [Phyllobacterium trifolii]|uniref:TolB-like protein/class 3 adenylate cyclase n=1 Tax=Phyllobacterium trifolii TaxID=300193 RepID=A0A839UGI5_9HYPH|nr:adenylate/guanylate cyclase domain-containing protein [Phyllobacterium trifolii]MBB3147639.1 TolB-like protein/class 3 adenylate cyclase [Phyllobacterium trifolii]